MRRKFKCYRVSLDMARMDEFRDFLDGNGFTKDDSYHSDFNGLYRKGKTYTLILRGCRLPVLDGLFLCVAEKKKSILPWKRDCQTMKINKYLKCLVYIGFAKEITINDYVYVSNKYYGYLERKMEGIAKGFEQFLKQLD